MTASQAQEYRFAAPEAVEGIIFRQGMRALAAGVSIVTTKYQDQTAGLTATAICSVSTAPPQLLVCINKKVRAHGLISRSGVFCVNVLSDTQQSVGEAFSGDAITDRFSIGRWTTLATGAPVLEKALANFDCNVIQAISASTHTIFLASVIAVSTQLDQNALAYFNGSYRVIA